MRNFNYKQTNNGIIKNRKTVLKNYQLFGYMGKCGSLSKKQRGALLNDLISKNLLDCNCKLTKNGLEVAEKMILKSI